MNRFMILIFPTFITPLLYSQVNAGQTVLSNVLTPESQQDPTVLTADTKLLSRQSRSYYDPRYGVGQPYDIGRTYDYVRPIEYAQPYEYARPYQYARPYDRYSERARIEYDRPRCNRCDDRYDRDRDRDDRDDRDDDRSSRGDKYDDRRVNHKPTYGNRYDRNKNDRDSDDDNGRYNNDRSSNTNNGTNDDNDSDKKRPYDDKDNRQSGKKKDRDRNRYDDRDRYRPDYYDRFLRDPSRERNDRPYYEDPYRERRPLYDRYPDRYDDGYASRYEPSYANRYDGYGYPGGRRPVYDERYDRGYDDGYGGYGPGVGRGPHDRPWDETYRGQSGWDAGGRGYYFASGRPDAAPASSWSQPGYTRPQESGWQNVGYSNVYRDPLEYRGSGYSQDIAYRQDLNAGFGQASGWHSVGERRPYRDQSGVAHLDDRDYDKSSRDQNKGYRQQNTYSQQNGYGQQGAYGQPSSYGQQGSYGQNYQANSPGTSSYSSSTTPSTSYLFQREDEQVSNKTTDTTKTPS